MRFDQLLMHPSFQVMRQEMCFLEVSYRFLSFLESEGFLESNQTEIIMKVRALSNTIAILSNSDLVELVPIYRLRWGGNDLGQWKMTLYV